MAKREKEEKQSGDKEKKNSKHIWENKKIKPIIKGSILDIEKQYKAKTILPLDGIPTGFEKLDQLTGGLRKKNLTVIAGRPSMGKTSLALDIAKSAAACGRPTIYLTLQSSENQILTKLLSGDAKVNSQRIDKGFLGEQDWPRLIASAARLSEVPLWIDDYPYLSPGLLNEKLTVFEKETDSIPELLVVDPVQMMSPGAGQYDSRSHALSHILQELKSTAKLQNIAILVVSDLNRSVEDRVSRRPQLSDLRDSGAIEDIADVVMFIYRDEVYSRSEDNPDKGLAEVFVAKNRIGPTGMIRLAFLEMFTCFENLASA